MSGMREAMADLRAAIEAMPARQALPPQARRATRLAMEKIAGGQDFTAAPPTTDRLDRAWHEVRAHCGAGRDLTDLPSATLRDIVWLLWNRDRRAASLPGVLAVAFRLAEASPLVMRRFITAWLIDFDPASPEIIAAGRLIAGALPRILHPRLANWRRASTDLRLFDPEHGPDTVARRLLAESGSGLMSTLGFDAQPQAAGGYMRAVLVRLAAQLPQKMRSADAEPFFTRASELFLFEDRLRFDEPRMRGRMADGMVGAWAGGASGPAALRDPVLHLLGAQIGDLRTQGPRWSEAGEETRRIVRGWLAQVTLAAFFDVIGQHAGAAGAGHQWDARQRFWSACLRKEWIADSWLVLGDNVRRNVALDRELRGSHGSLIASGRADHSALLMKIGTTVFMEWSHMGKLRAWPARSGAAPPFAHVGSYRIGQLAAPGLEFPPPGNRPDLTASGSDGITHVPHIWQGRVAALLWERDNLRLDRSEWQ